MTSIDPWIFYWFAFSMAMVFAQAFYSMMEMACVSFNKVRLQYYVSKGNKRASLINHLLKHPSYLFGTTLIGVNVAMMVGSECSRNLYASLGLSPDLAPITQVLIVVILGELAPMFAARRYAEHVAILGIPVIWASSKLMIPFIWGIKHLTSFVEFLVGSQSQKTNIFLTKEELQKLLEEGGDLNGNGSEEFNHIVSNIFRLRSKTARQVMTPLSQVAMVPSNCSIGHMRKILLQTPSPVLPVYNKSAANIVAIAKARDLLRAGDHKRVRDFSSQPWFITEKTGATQVLKQFRHNNQSLAVVLNEAGKSIGILTLDDLLDEIFAKSPR